MGQRAGQGGLSASPWMLLQQLGAQGSWSGLSSKALAAPESCPDGQEQICSSRSSSGKEGKLDMFLLSCLLQHVRLRRSTLVSAQPAEMYF